MKKVFIVGGSGFLGSNFINISKKNIRFLLTKTKEKYLIVE